MKSLVRFAYIACLILGIGQNAKIFIQVFNAYAAAGSVARWTFIIWVYVCVNVGRCCNYATIDWCSCCWIRIRSHSGMYSLYNFLYLSLSFSLSLCKFSDASFLAQTHTQVRKLFIYFFFFSVLQLRSKKSVRFLFFLCFKDYILKKKMQ